MDLSKLKLIEKHVGTGNKGKVITTETYLKPDGETYQVVKDEDGKAIATVQSDAK